MAKSLWQAAIRHAPSWLTGPPFKPHPLRTRRATDAALPVVAADRRIPCNFFNPTPLPLSLVRVAWARLLSPALLPSKLAGENKRVLLVSTDPASNVGQVFSTEIGNKVTEIREVADWLRWK